MRVSLQLEAGGWRLEAGVGLGIEGGRLGREMEAEAFSLETGSLSRRR
jgi:hypothetical protein